jgi:hypothetical protein
MTADNHNLPQVAAFSIAGSGFLIDIASRNIRVACDFRRRD